MTWPRLHERMLWTLDLSVAEGNEHFLKVKARKGKTADSASFEEITNWLEKISHCDCARIPVILELLPDSPLITGNLGDLGKLVNSFET